MANKSAHRTNYRKQEPTDDVAIYCLSANQPQVELFGNSRKLRKFENLKLTADAQETGPQTNQKQRYRVTFADFKPETIELLLDFAHSGGHIRPTAGVLGRYCDFAKNIHQCCWLDYSKPSTDE